MINDAILQDITHLLFLDIDEFWTSRDFVTSIHQCLEDTGYSDVISFAWANKVDENDAFSGPYSQHTRLRNNVNIKSLFGTSLEIRRIGVHNVRANNATYLLGDGRPNVLNGRPRSIHESCSMEDLINFFILHRIWRSEIEYISRLGQGLNLERTGRAISRFELKENRRGFLISPIYERDSVFEIQNQILMEYEEGYQ